MSRNRTHPSSIPEEHVLERVGRDGGVGADHGHGARPQVGAPLHLAQELQPPDPPLRQVEPREVELQ